MYTFSDIPEKTNFPAFGCEFIHKRYEHTQPGTGDILQARAINVNIVHVVVNALLDLRIHFQG